MLHPLLHTLSTLLLCIGNAIGYDYVISTEGEYSTFVSRVNAGTSYSGTTVLLDSDLSLSGHSISPIGTSSSYCFQGMFDGQGHIISNLSISASLENVGMFGYSSGLTIRNVVLDDSCSVESTYPGNSCVGGVIGYCYAKYSQCNIYNSVNMASVTFSGSSSSGNLFLGGIAGRLQTYYSSSTSGYEAYVQNCANYGPITHSGTISKSYIGGIVGYSYGYYYSSSSSSSYFYYTYLQNCLNYGTITHNGTTTNELDLGGITGRTRYAYLKNCLSIGAISTSYSNYIGSIVGYVFSSTYLYYCYFTSNVGISSYCGYGSPDLDHTPTSSTTISDAVNNLKSYASDNGWNKWLLNTNSAPITFKYNDNTGFTTSSRAIILPVLLSYGSNSFMGWFGDTNYSGTFTPESISAAATLYGLYGVVVTVTFDGNGGNVSQQRKYVLYNYAYGTLPGTIPKTRYSFKWFTKKNDGTEVTKDTTVTSSSDHTLYAHWITNNYTLTFVFDNGTDPEVRILNYNEEIVYPESITKEGYTFSGWDNNITNMPASDLIITAQWTINNYTLTFVLGNGTDPEVGVLNFSQEVVYPADPEREGYTFSGWDNSITNMPANDLIITAQWTANKYTINFDPSGGGVTQNSKEVTFDSAYGELPTPNLNGHTFVGWFTENEGEEIKEDTIMTTTRNHTLYAHWVINNYTVTFVFNNGTDPEEKTFKYNGIIDYPADPVRDGYKFNGWDNNHPTHMPAFNFILTAQWSASDTTTIAIIIGVVVFVLVVMAALLFIIFFCLRRRNKNSDKFYRRRSELDEPFISKTVSTSTDNSGGIHVNREVTYTITNNNNSIWDTPIEIDEDASAKHFRAVTESEDDLEIDVAVRNTRSILSHLYPKSYKRLPIREALLKAELTYRQADLVCIACANVSRIAADEGRLFDGFTEEDAAAIAMYTYDFGGKEFESNPYRIINKSLVGRNYANLQKASGIMYLVMTALRKLSRVTGIKLYRGVRGEVNLDRQHYYKGNTITWMGLSSASPDMDATKRFLARSTSNENSAGTLFIIEGGWGYNIQPYSLFPDEAEILIEPERQFKVISVIQSNVTIINLQMLDTPISLPQVFGDEW